MNKIIQPIIYKTTNKINNKIYIGKDLYNNDKYLGSGKLLKLAFKKYGEENFQKDIVEYCIDINHMNEREIFWIRELNTFPPIGYNINFGGKGGNTYEHRTEEEKLIFKENLKIKKKNSHHTEETKETMRRVRSGVPQKRRSNVECPHCHKIGDKINFSRWHFDYCKENPNRTIKDVKKIECEFCHEIFIKSGFNFHFDYCKKNPNRIDKITIVSEETKRKISESHRGKTQSEETKNKKRIAILGIKRSDETKNKHRINMILRWKIIKERQ